MELRAQETRSDDAMAGVDRTTVPAPALGEKRGEVGEVALGSMAAAEGEVQRLAGSQRSGHRFDPACEARLDDGRRRRSRHNLVRPIEKVEEAGSQRNAVGDGDGRIAIGLSSIIEPGALTGQEVDAEQGMEHVVGRVDRSDDGSGIGSEQTGEADHV